MPEAPTFSVRRYGLAAVGLLVLLIGGVVWLAPWAPAGPTMVEEVVPLRCLGADDAMTGLAALLRVEPASTVRAREGARVLQVRTTPALLEQARTWLEDHDRGCAGP